MNTREAARKDIHFNLAPEANVYVSADRSMITTVMQNLVSNAINFTPASGQITIDCRTKGHQAVVSVADTGVGISEENLARLFQFDYAQTKISSAEGSGGGLGLIICHEMIQKNNGTISAESEAGKGSRFVFTLPAITRDEAGEPLNGSQLQREYESSEELLAGNGSVPPEAVPEIISTLSPLFDEVTRVLSIENLEVFSKSVTDLGEKYMIGHLSNYGRTLSRLTRAHQIDQIIKLLPGFRKYLDSLTA
jgi:anti-sigma regulatory factor (Ser/Thr protein kinase)